jgi:predicted amidohydrolase YtcJ
MDREYGSLTAGKWADMTVLSNDPRRVPVEALGKINVDMTFVDGRVVYER